jgi:hypothetical protein
MKKLLPVAILMLVLIPTALTFAQTPEFGAKDSELTGFIETTQDFFNTIVVPFVLSIGFLFFVWGMFLYFIKGGHDEGEQEKGKSLMFYALGGFVLILSFWGLVNILVDGVGTGDQKLEDLPTVQPASYGQGV